MKDFFQTLKELDPVRDNLTVTVLEGKTAGEKCILSDGVIVWASDENGVLKANEKELSSFSGNGIRSLGGIRVYIESPGQIKKLVVLGCGHVSIPIIKLGKMTGFHVTAIDDREEFTLNAKEAGADRVLAAPFEEALQEIRSDRDTFVVTVTRGHRYDELCIKAISGMQYAYIGMMGSRRRVETVRENLKKMGVPDKITADLHAPIGLDIGSETPEEIAVSVLAEVIKVKNSVKDLHFPEDIMEAALSSKDKVLATIIRRSGSAPREEGTKMLVLKDSAVNTIGGGLLEARVIEEARDMISGSIERIRLISFELNASAESTEGEVCGGNLEVMLERFL